MPPEATPQTTTPAADPTGYLDQLPPEVAPYVVLAIIVWWLTRSAYKDQTQLLDRYETRMDQFERTLSNLTQDLEQKERELADARRDLDRLQRELADARDAEERCSARMEEMEERYQERIAELKDKIAELEHEIDQLRSERSEPHTVGVAE